MTEITLKIDERTKAGKAFMAMLQFLASDKKGVEVVSYDGSPYNPAFVKKVLKAAERGNYTTVNPKDIWGSLGLK